MTENAHQMTSNQLPPGKRKPGFVGCAAGPEVAIMSPDGRLLGAGEEGEVVTRGPNVTPGYENNPAANDAGLRLRLVPHRRPGLHGRGRLSSRSPAA